MSLLWVSAEPTVGEEGEKKEGEAEEGEEGVERENTEVYNIPTLLLTNTLPLSVYPICLQVAINV